MKAVQITEYGGPETLKVREVAQPPIDAGEMLIELNYAGVSFGDTYMRKGYYRHPHTYSTTLPYIPGLDGAGIVVQVGANIDHDWVGRACAFTLTANSYAQYVAVPAWKVVPLPADFDRKIACALMTNGLTAYYLTRVLYPVRVGDVCLVLAAGGSVGQLVTQLAKMAGAKVIGVAGRQASAQAALESGADEVIQFNSTKEMVDRVRALTDGLGVDVAYDSVGLSTFRHTMKCLKPRGMCVLYGAASGVPDCVRPMEDLAENGSIFVTRPHLSHYMNSKEAIATASDFLFKAVMSGILKVEIDPYAFALSDAEQAHRRLEDRKTQGKVLLDLQLPI